MLQVTHLYIYTFTMFVQMFMRIYILALVTVYTLFKIRPIVLGHKIN